MWRLRHINNPVLSSLKMKGIPLLYFEYQMYCSSGAVFQGILRLHLVKTLVAENYKN
jgi:hypothetical protein